MYPDHCIYRVGADRCNKGHDIKSLMRPCNAQEVKFRDENYPDSDLEDIAFFKRIPCNEGNNVRSCPDFRLPTADQLAAHQKKVNERVEAVLKGLAIVRPLIMEDLENRGLIGKTVSGQVGCPVCNEGTVSYRYAGSVNGHITANCSIENCIQWIE